MFLINVSSCSARDCDVLKKTKENIQCMARQTVRRVLTCRAGFVSIRIILYL